MWPSLDRFLQEGWGHVAVVDDTVASWCTAAYVGDRFCGSGIETAAERRNRGLGTATGAHFIADSRDRGRIRHWERGADNCPRPAWRISWGLAWWTVPGSSLGVFAELLAGRASRCSAPRDPHRFLSTCVSSKIHQLVWGRDELIAVSALPDDPDLSLGCQGSLERDLLHVCHL